MNFSPSLIDSPELYLWIAFSLSFFLVVFFGGPVLYGSLYSKARNIQQKKQNALLVLQDASNQEKLLTIRFQGLQDSRSALQNTTIDHIVECRKILCSLPVHRLPLPSVDVLAKAVVCEHIEQAKPEAVSAQDVDKIFELLDLQS